MYGIWFCAKLSLLYVQNRERFICKNYANVSSVLREWEVLERKRDKLYKKMKN